MTSGCGWSSVSNRPNRIVLPVISANALVDNDAFQMDE